MRKMIYILVAVSIFLFTSCNNNKVNNKVLASFDSGKITVSDFEQTMLINKFKGNLAAAAKSSVKDRKNFLLGMIKEKIEAQMIKKYKLDTLQTIRKAKESALNRASKEILYQDVIIDKVIPESLIRKTFDDSKLLVKASHILIKNSKENSKKTKQKVDSIYNLLVNGKADFAKLATKFSEDTYSAKKGGDLGWFGKGKMVKAFDETVFKLKKGEISQPVHSKFGWHIIKKTDSKISQSKISYEKKKEGIKQELLKQKKIELYMRTNAYVREITKKYNVKIDTVNIKKFIDSLKVYEAKIRKNEKPKGEKFNAVVPKGKSKESPLNSFSETDRKLVLATYKDQTVTIGSTLKKLVTYYAQRKPKLNTVSDVITNFQGQYLDKLLDEDVSSKNYATNPKVLKKVEKNLVPAYKRAIQAEIILKDVKNPTDDELKKYYEANKEKKYKNKEGYKDFEKIKKQIASYLLRHKKKDVLKEWDKNLFKKFKINIDNIELEDTFYILADDKK